MYAKLIARTQLEYAPESVKKENTYYTPYPAEMLIEDGYKEVINTASPQKDGYYYTAYYTETETQIIQGWDEHKVLPTELEKLEAQVLYTAMMTNTLIGEN